MRVRVLWPRTVVALLALELHADAGIDAEIATLGHRTAGFHLRILEVVPDEGEVQIEVPLDFELQRRHGMVRIQARLLARQRGVNSLNEFEAPGDVGFEAGL